VAEAKKGFADKLHMELVPVDGIRADARALDYGAYTKGYGVNSWLMSALNDEFEWSVAYGATLRHLTAWFDGEDIDPESGLSHMDHVGANVKFLQTFIAQDIGCDDREMTMLHKLRPGT